MKYATIFAQYFITLISRPIFYFFFHFKVVGVENLPKDAAVIFATNHSSKLDPFLLCAALPLGSRHIPLYFVSREKRFYNSGVIEKIFYGGWLFKLLGSYPAYSGLKDYELSLREHVALLNSGKSVCIYPEGGLSRNGHRAKSRGGVGFLASKTNCPVIPVHIDGIEDFTSKDFFFRKRKVVITFGRPQHFKEHPLFEAIKSFSQFVVGAIYALVERTNK
jgi:1-acyl-sn-glycerol-3-phosphate acyltransferase